MNGWVLAIDFGTSYTAAALASEERVEVVSIDGDQRMPSGVLLDPEGRLVVGKVARNQAPLYPERYEPTPKRYLGGPPLRLGGIRIEATEVVAAVLEKVYREARTQRAGISPDEVRLTHPAGWKEPSAAALVQAAAGAGIQDPVLVPEPHAAALYCASARPPEPGAHVAVYDLGGGTFDVAILTRTEGGFELRGQSGSADIAGEQFDHLLYTELVKKLSPEEQQTLRGSAPANLYFQEEVTKAKEMLSEVREWQVMVRELGRALLVTRDPELRDLLTKDVEATADILADAISQAGVELADISAIYLVGGSSRIPLVEEVLKRRFGDERVFSYGNPKTVVALGAAAIPADEIVPPTDLYLASEMIARETGDGDQSEEEKEEKIRHFLDLARRRGDLWKCQLELAPL